MSTNGQKPNLTLSILDQSPVHQGEDSAQAFQRTIELAGPFLSPTRLVNLERARFQSNHHLGYF